MSINQKLYTCAFYFWRGEVLLVEKNFPSWQKGLLNGIGGKVEGGEVAAATCVREFYEETGLRVPGPEWHQFASEGCKAGVAHDERGDGYRVMFYRARAPDDGPRPTIPLANDVGEWLFWHDIDAVEGQVVGNLRWLIPLAMDWRRLYAVVSVDDDIKTRPSW